MNSNNKKKVMVLGASSLQLPMIELAKQRGYYVIGIDYNPNAIGFAYVDKAVIVSTTDLNAVYEQALYYKPDYILTCTSDMPVRTVAYVNEKLGKKNGISYKNALCATDKGEMRKRFAEKGIPSPRHTVISSETELLEVLKEYGELFIIKPTDNAASRGVVLCDMSNCNPIDCYNTSLAYSRSGRVIIEEYMRGKEVSVESFTINGVSNVIAITDKYTTGAPQFVETGHSEPSCYPPKLQDEIKALTIKAIEAIGLTDGPSHTEICITESGLKVIEIAARLGGDFITSKLVPLSTGVDLIKASFDQVVGENVHLNKNKNLASAIRFIPSKQGVIKSISGVDEALRLDGIDEIDIYCKPGDLVEDVTSSNNRVGHIIAVAKTPSDAIEIICKAYDKIEIEYV